DFDNVAGRERVAVSGDPSATSPPGTRRDVHHAPRVSEEPVDASSRPQRQRRPWPAREQGGPIPAVSCELTVPEGEDARIDPTQNPAARAAVDTARAEPGFDELLPRDRAALGVGERRGRRIGMLAT